MSKFKTINFANSHLFGAALLATVATHGLNPSLGEAQASGQVKPETIAIDNPNLISVVNDPPLVPSASTVELSETSLILAQAEDSGNAEEDNREPKNKLWRTISLAFFILFFVPLGIFYPLFLFYKMLLIKPEGAGNNLVSKSKSDAAKPIDTDFYGSPQTSDLKKATVSKLQIAFSPPARELRKELSQVSSAVNLQVEDHIVELMHQTIDVLIEQAHWTHISHSSATLPLNQVRPEFDQISEQERHKFNGGKQGLINYNRNVSSKQGYERSYSYVVVTLIFCTAHATPLFKTISTKKQLAAELIKLRKIEENAVIKFELLWNPQQEEVYISNDQLLIEYDEMTRLL
ncbi:MAG: DUF1517 domain-containing protein [Cyanobacteria bacterium J06600_6]